MTDNLDLKDEFAMVVLLMQQESFHKGPDRPSSGSEVDVVTNEKEQRMLVEGIGQEVVVEELEEENGAHTLNPKFEHSGVDLNEKEKKFLNLYRSCKSYKQGEVPDNIDLKIVNTAEEQNLPTVWDTPEEVEAKEEDVARRAAYLEKLSRHSSAQSDKLKEAHDRYLSTFDKLKNKH